MIQILDALKICLSVCLSFPTCLNWFLNKTLSHTNLYRFKTKISNSCMSMLCLIVTMEPYDNVLAMDIYLLGLRGCAFRC